MSAAPPPPPSDDGGSSSPPSSGSGGGASAPPPGGSGFTAGGGAGGSSPGSVDLGQAFSFGWEAFKANAQPLVLGTLLLLVAVVVVGGLWFFVSGLLLGRGGAGGGLVGLVLLTVGSLAFVIGAVIVQAATIRVGLKLVDGQSIELGDLTSTDRLGPILVTSLLIGVGTMVGVLLCVLPGIVFGFATSFALFYVIDQRSEPVEAIRASIDLFRENLGPALLLVFLTSLVAQIGSYACGIGMLVTWPIAYIALAHGYRQLRGQPVVG